jgi:aryl-alcohol dehydrogenase-like predicted oxidoreductase
MPSRRSVFKTAAALTIAPHLASADDKAKPRPDLIRKKVPSSGETIPAIGIGTNRYGVGDDVEKLAPLKATLAKFAEYGDGMIDTAPMYGSSESVLGDLIGQLGLKDSFFIATKCDVHGGDTTREQLATSQAKLKSGKLDLVAVHNLANWQQQLPVLQEAKAAGKIRYVGITTSRNRQFEQFAEVMKSEKLDFVQLNYSLADREAEQNLLAIAQDKGIAVVVNLPYARGRLFQKVKGIGLPSWASEFDATSWGQFFLKFVISHPAVTAAIPGTTKVHHLEDNMAAATGRLASAEQRLAMQQFFDKL